MEKYILLVEDNPVAVKVAKILFERLNCKVDVAQDGEMAIEMATKHHYDAISMDIGLPLKNGVEACIAIRQYEHDHPELDPVPIIAVSANTGMEEREQYLASGMQGVIAKPFTEKQAMEFLSLCNAVYKAA